LVFPNSTNIGEYIIYVTIIDSKYSVRSYPLLINITGAAINSTGNNNNVEITIGNITYYNMTMNQTEQTNDTFEFKNNTNISANIFSNILGAYIYDISQSGVLKVKFSEEILVPDKFKDFGDDVLKLRIDSKSDELINFTWEILKFSDLMMTI
jgi:hypothetical protein